MVQFLPGKKSFAANLGAGLAQGLSEQLPKEIERGRLAKGLQQFSEQHADMSPLQQLAYLASIPGAVDRPQLIQSFGDLALKSAQAGALKKGVPEQGQTPGKPTRVETAPTKIPQGRTEFPSGTLEGAGAQKPTSITTTEPTRAAIESFIPKSYPQLVARGNELFEGNKELYNNDPNQALQAAIKEDAQEQAINAAYQKRRENQLMVQDRLKSDLSSAANRAGVKIPDNIYSPIEQEAINKVKNGEMTEEEAAQHYRPILDSISRDYQGLGNLTSAQIISSNPASIKGNINSLQEKFKERNDLENFSDELISNGLSPGRAYNFGYPLKDYPELNSYVKGLKKLESKISYAKGYPEMEVPPDFIRDRTLEISEKLAKLMGKTASPLSIAEELKKKGYDPDTWIDYVLKHKKELDLSQRQARELDKPKNWFSTPSDLWLLSWSNLD